MLESMNNNTFEYQRLSKEEMERRGILGRLIGPCASFTAPTRNGRHYSEQLWENVFNDPIMKERIENGVCYGELGHPTDREETDMEKIALCLAEVPKKGKDGKLRAVFDILSTPNGKILKSLCDYGSTIGISSRGSGDLETDWDGNESVNPDTYTCEGFDAVLIPAVKEARLQYVNESLNKKRYNKTLRDKLTESINKEDETNQKIMLESLDTLGIKLDESEDLVDDIDESLTEANDVGDDSQFMAYQQRMSNKVTDEQSSKLEEMKFTFYNLGYRHDKDCVEQLLVTPNSKNNISFSLTKEGETDASQVQEEVVSTLTAFGAENINIHQAIPYRGNALCSGSCYIPGMTLGESIQEEINQETDESLIEARFGGYKYQYGVHVIGSDGRDRLLGGSKTIEGAVDTAIRQAKQIVDNPWMSNSDKSNYISNMYIADDDAGHEIDTTFEDEADRFLNMLNEQETAEINNEVIETLAADNDGALVEELQKSLKLNKKLDEKIVALQEKLSAGYAKEVKLNEQIEGYKSRIFKLSKSTKEVRVLNEKLVTANKSKETIDNRCKKLTESINKKNNTINELKESLNEKDEHINSLKVKVNESVKRLKAKTNSLNEITEKYETLNKDLNQLKESYSKKIEQQNALVEKYKNIAMKSVDKYIDTQAIRLGVHSSEIKNRLPESYSFKDIDLICEDLQEYKLNMSNLPFSTTSRLNEGISARVSNVSNKTLVPMEEDVDELTLRLAGLK